MLKRLENFLKKSKVAYKVIPHKTVYTTFDLSQTLHEDLKAIVKTLLVQAGREFIFAVVPGNRRLDIMKLKKLINAERKARGDKACQKVKIASEAQIKTNITKKAGTLVPFGSLYKKKTYIDKLLLKNKKIILNAGSFEEAIKITSSVYIKIEKPIEGTISKVK